MFFCFDIVGYANKGNAFVFTRMLGKGLSIVAALYLVNGLLG